MGEWYVVRTKPRQEQIAQENLVRQGYQCFCPRIAQWRKRFGKRQLCIEAFFPGYLFIQLDLGLTNTAPIRSSRGVNSLVSFGSRIMPVPQDLIETMRQRMTDDGLVEKGESDYKYGQEVRVEEGPMVGLDAIFQTKRGEDRAVLLLNILGGKRRVELPIAVLK